MQNIGKGREIMKTKKYCLILAVITAISFIPALGQIEPGQLVELQQEPLLIARANPALAGIDNLHVTIIHPENEPNGLEWEKLKIQINDKINKAGMKVFIPEPGVMYKLPVWPELIIRVNILKLEKSEQYAFHIQTSLARMVHLEKGNRLAFKTDVWKTEPVMQAASVKNTPDIITDIVLKQTDTFITACLDAKQKIVQDADTKAAISQKEPVRPSTAEESVEYVYVASKKSKVFHKSTCNWAKRIKPENLVRYKTRQDAINDGKRPCKSCNP